ncbi:MAG: SMI1/KNR4 family protein [Acidobacteriota bacterium]|nr:SMI1/KNR4 family protein [Acidobacteriota bacterium]
MEQLEPTYVGSEITDSEILGRIPEDYRRLLNQTNGFILFDGGLHVRGAVLSPAWHSLRRVWLGDSALHKLFPAINESDVPFAQDCLGDQFVLRAGVVHKLDAEAGEVETLGMNLEAFLNHAFENPVEFLSLHPLLQFMSEGGELRPGQLLSVYPPFITEESAGGVSLRAISMFDRIGFLADFARQVAAISKREI